VGNEEEEVVGKIIGWAVQRWASVLMAHFRNAKILYFNLS